MEYWYNKDIQKVNKYKHLVMLDLKEKELKQLSKGDDFVRNFQEKITELNENETFQSAMTYEEDQKLILNTEKKMAFENGVSQGISQGMTQGITQGAKQEKIEIAKLMLSKQLDIETISECTGLKIDEINNLKENK